MAGRPRIIDRNKVLDIAEAIVRERGAAALTIDAVAKAAGITKGGVQYAFGTKEQLVDAMYDRWKDDFDAKMTALAGETPDLEATLRAYLEIGLRKEDEAAWARSSVMMAVMVQMPHQMERYRKESRELFDRLDLTTDEGRKWALALVAADGAFFLRGFGFMQFGDREWGILAKEIETLVPPIGKSK